VAALKNVDLPVFGFPTTPRRREYDAGMLPSVSTLPVVQFMFLEAG
jgi:hypothetical protein